jgi:hypothetical protein
VFGLALFGTVASLQTAKNFSMPVTSEAPDAAAAHATATVEKICARRSNNSNNIVAGLALAGLRCEGHLRVLISDNILVSQNGF